MRPVQPPPRHWVRRVAEKLTDLAVTVLVHLGALVFPEDRPGSDRKGHR